MNPQRYSFFMLCMLLPLLLFRSTNASPHSSDSVTSRVARGGYALASSHVPVPGSTYQTAVRLPFLGSQIFQLNVQDQNTGHLSISGRIMSVEAPIEYQVCEASGAVSFALPDSVVKVLRRFRSKLLDARYIPGSDTVQIKVRCPLPGHILLELNRT